jgi:hypothetical protein
MGVGQSALAFSFLSAFFYRVIDPENYQVINHTHILVLSAGLV